MKETAVEWLVDESMKLVLQFMKGTLNEDTLDDVISEIVTKAKKREKEQMELCYKVGIIDGNNGEILNFEQYYNETFNTNKMEEEYCPKCGELENIHTNYDWSKKDRPVEEYLCNECGTYFKQEEQ
jgi:hypothetical protein